jgi:hypothetical protein
VVGRTRSLRGVVAAGTLLATVVAPAVASADVTKEQCVDANATAQDLRRDRKLSQAREQLRLCSDPSCPALVRSDCVKRLDDLEQVQPTLAFHASDAAGNDLTAVTVTVDGVRVTSTLDGTSFPIDPGSHSVSFEAAGMVPLTRTVVLTEGDRGRREGVVLVPVVVTAAVPAAPAVKAGTGWSTGSVVGLTLGASGVLGLAVGSIFGALAMSEKARVASLCGVTCDASAHAEALTAHTNGLTDATVATIGFVAGGALLAGGGVAILAGRRADRAPRSASWFSVGPTLGASGTGLVLRGTF